MPVSERKSNINRARSVPAQNDIGLLDDISLERVKEYQLSYKHTYLLFLKTIFVHALVTKTSQTEFIQKPEINFSFKYF